MNCCAACFGDRGLRKDIIPLRSTEIGRCSYCGSENVMLIKPDKLADYFGLVISAYQRSNSGKLLVQWFREDWGMFDHPAMDDSRARDLLAEILENTEIVRDTFAPAGAIFTDQLREWEKLHDELMYHNRFFPAANIDLPRLERLLSQLILDSEEIPRLWYRARIQDGETPFVAAQMGAPPSRSASHGRANPAGIPYLYLGSTQATAISEIRPHTGELVCVADFAANNDLKLVDLRNPRKMVSPFLLVDAAAVGEMRSDLPYLERLGDELTRPVVPTSAAIDYTPSQYLCEFIKKRGYNGVIYRSSLSEGMNLALFDPALARSSSVRQYRVTRVSVDFAEGT